MEDLAKGLNKKILRNNFIRKLFLLNKKDKIKNNKDKITSIALKSGYIDTLKIMVNYRPEIQLKDIESLFKSRKYKNIEKILLNTEDLIDRKMVYTVINESLLEEITKNKNIKLLNYLINSKIFRDNEMLFRRISVISFKPHLISIYKVAFTHLLKRIYKQRSVYGNQKWFLTKSLKSKGNEDFLRFFLELENIEYDNYTQNNLYMLTHILFETPLINKEYLDILFEDKKRKLLVEREYNLIKEERLKEKELKDYPSIRRVEEYFKYKKIANF
jgi:hypothetical protein